MLRSATLTIHFDDDDNNDNNGFEQQQQRVTGIKFKQRWRRSENTGSSGEGHGSSSVDNKRKAEGEHLEDSEREWRETVEEEEESLSRKAMKYLKTLERAEAKKVLRRTQEIVELAEGVVNEEEVE